MKKSFFIITAFFLISILTVSCASVPKEEIQEWISSSDGVFQVRAQKDGIHLKTATASRQEKYILVEASGIKQGFLLKLKNTHGEEKEYVYPFVKKGSRYTIYVITKSLTKDTFTYSELVELVALGGAGEAGVSAKAAEKSYNSKQWKIILDEFNCILPVKDAVNIKITGKITSKKLEEPYFYNDFVLNKKEISLKPVMGKIRGSKFSLSLNYTFEYNGNTFAQEFFNNKDFPFTDTNTVFEVKDTGLPAVYLTTKTGKNVASKEKYETAGLRIGERTFSGKIKGRGNSSWGQFPKHSYTIKLDKKAEILGLPENKSWVLVSNYTDKTLIRNEYAYYLGHEVFNRMIWNPTFKQVDLFINNEYAGTYLLGEKISIGEKRINIDKNSFIVEMNRREDEDFNFRTIHDVSISLKEPDVADQKTKARVQKIIQDAENAMFAENFKDPEKGYAMYLDVDSFVDWYLINEFAKNVDSAWFSSVYIVYDSKDKKLHLGPLWDYDLGFGNINYNDCDQTTGFYISKRGVWFNQLMKDPAFRQKVKKRWIEKRKILKKSIEVQLNKYVKNIQESSYYNFEVWPILGQYVWPNADGFQERLSLNSEVEYLKNWCMNRFVWMDKEISAW